MTQSMQFDFDSNLLSKVRLAIMAALMTLNTAEFTELKELLNVTQGNLSIHGAKLEEARYIKIIKKFVKDKPVTVYKLTDYGRKALINHIQQLKNLMQLNS